MGNLSFKTRPVTYKQFTEFDLENFILQKKLIKIFSIEDDGEKQKTIYSVFNDLAILQNKVFATSISQIDTGTEVVTDPVFIKELVDNADRGVYTALKEHISNNNNVWKIPKVPVKCESCGATDELIIQMDNSSFFGNA